MALPGFEFCLTSSITSMNTLTCLSLKISVQFLRPNEKKARYEVQGSIYSNKHSLKHSFFLHRQTDQRRLAVSHTKESDQSLKGPRLIISEGIFNYDNHPIAQ